MTAHRLAGAIAAVGLALLPGSAFAQLVLDGSLTNAAGLPIAGPVPLEANEYRVTDDRGQFSADGANRFHSFSAFDLLDSNQAAVFSSDAAPQRVIVRVTQPSFFGGSAINGTLRSTIPGADLYFLNPFGISFGGGAAIDVLGSFYASTANALRFTEGPDFPTGEAVAPVSLSAASPRAFGFTSASPAQIAVERAELLKVRSGETLSFTAGNFDMTTRSTLATTVRAPGATVQIGAASGAVDLPVDLAALDAATLPPPPSTNTAAGAIRIRSDGAIDVSSPDGGGTSAGRIVIRGGRFVLDDARLTAENDHSGDAAGPIDIAVNGAIVLSRGSQVSSTSEASGAAGAILLEASSIEIDGSRIASEARGTGAGGAIEIDAATLRVLNTQGFLDGSFVASVAGEGQGGNLTVRAANVELMGGGQLRADTTGSGNAGNLELLEADTVHLSGVDGPRPSGLTSRALVDATGSAGNMRIVTRVLEAENGAQIATETFGAGAAGDLAIEASERVAIRGGEQGFTAVSAASRSFGVPLGQSGDLSIETPHLVLANGGQVTVSTDGTLNAGALSIEAGDVSISGRDPIGNEAGLFARSNSFDAEGGNGGDITVTATGNIDVANGGRVSVQTLGGGDAGNILLDAGGAIRVAGGTVGSISSGAGAGRQVALVADGGVSITDGGLISARATSAGNAGFIRIDAGPRLEIVRASVTTESTNASGGRVDLVASGAIVLQDASITTSVLNGFGGGGDMAIDPEFVILDSSQIRANAISGPGGNISIRAGTFLATDDSIVDASSALGIDGNVVIDSPNPELTGKLAVLPQGFLNASELLANPCLARTQAEGSFVVRARGMQPPPDAALTPDAGEGLDCSPPKEIP